MISIRIKQNPIIFVRPTKIFRLSDSCPATTQKLTQRLKYTGNKCDFHPLVTESPKILSASVWASLLDYNFLLYILSGKHKMHRTFLKFGGFVRQREVLVKTVLRVPLG